MDKELHYDINKVIECLSHDRLSTYLLFDPRGDEKAVLGPYTQMQELSSGLFIYLQYFEVTLRNRIYDVLAQHYRKRALEVQLPGEPEKWLHWMPKSTQSWKEIKKAESWVKENITTRQAVIGDVISKLSLGTWIALLREFPGEKEPLHFWSFVRDDLFPNAKGKTKEEILGRLKEINRVRNRLFHYEPIWNEENLPTCHDGIGQLINKQFLILRAIYWLSSDMYNFIWSVAPEPLLGEKARAFSDALLRGDYSEWPQSIISSAKGNPISAPREPDGATQKSSVTEDRGMFTYTFKSGETARFPATEKGYALFERLRAQKEGPFVDSETPIMGQA